MLGIPCRPVTNLPATQPEPIISAAQALRVSGVSLTYPAKRRQAARTALDNVSLAIDPGQSVAMLGPNGSGKSTLLRIICGLLPNDGGSVAVFDMDNPAARRGMLGVVFQSDSLDPHLTVRENLRDQAALYGIAPHEARQRIDASLEAAGLADRRDDLVKTLSLGLARRVDLCRALLHQPRLLLLDEPTVGLDPAAREAFLALIDDKRESENLTVLMSTHLMDEADRQDRVVLLHEGKLVADDTPADLRSNLGQMLLTVHDSAWLPQEFAHPLESWRRASGVWTLQLGDDVEQVRAIAAELAGAGVAYSIAPPTLADVFEHFTGTKLSPQPSRLLPPRGGARSARKAGR